MHDVQCLLIMIKLLTVVVFQVTVLFEDAAQEEQII